MLQRRWLLALLVLVGVHAPVFGQDEATLNWKFTEKAFYQEMTTETKQTMTVMGMEITQNQKQTFYFSWAPGKKDGDNLPIVQTIEGVKMDIEIGGNKINYDSTKEAPGGSNPLTEFFKALVGSKFTLTLNTKTLEVTKVEGREAFLEKLVKANQQMKPLLEQILSDKSLKQMADPTFAVIKPGEKVVKGMPSGTWPKTTELDMGPIGKYENKYTYTYDGKDAKKLDRIKVTTVLTYTPPAESAAGGLPFKIKSADLKSKDATGTILFDNDKGRLAESTTTITLEGKLSIEIGGQTTEVTLKQTQTTSVKTMDDNPIKPATPPK